MLQIDWALTASWAQAISNTVVLFLIYLQMRQVNVQMIQNDDLERFRRSWEFVKLYREELRDTRHDFEDVIARFDPNKTEPGAEICSTLDHEFFKPRVHLFILL